MASASTAPERDRPSALLFDLGGVLIGVDLQRVFRAFASLGPLTATDLALRATADSAYRQFERGEIDAPGYFQHLRHSLDLNGTDAELAAGWNAIFVGAIDETATLLRQAAARLRCFALSNSNSTHHDAWRDAYADVLAPFEEVFVSYQLGARKPEPAAYRAVSAATGVALAEMLFFDDSAENIAGARAVGLPAVQVRSPDDVRRALHDAGLLDPPA